MKIKVSNLHKVESKKSKVLCFCSVSLDDITINDVKLISGKEDDFIAMPTRAYEKDGETKYANVVWIDDPDLIDEIADEVMRAYRKADK